MKSVFWPAALGVSLAVGLPTAGPAGAQTLPETMTEANVMAFVDEQGISTVEAFIEALPPLHKQHYVSVFKSDSPSADSISTSHPRIVSWGADARFIVTWTTNPDDPFTESAEFLQPVPEEGRWIAGVIDFSGDSPSLRHPQACTNCHGDINKPLWGMFDSWEGTELEHEGGSASGDEAALYETMIASTHPRLAPLERGGYRRTRAKALEFAGRQLQSPNWEFSQVLALRHAEVLFNRLRAREGYDQVAEFVACADAPPWNGEGLRQRVIAQFSQERYNPRLLSGSLSAIQGINPLAPQSLADYSTGQSLSYAVAFLVFHDLWQRDEGVAGLYRQTSNDQIFGDATATLVSSEEMVRYELGTATAENELLAGYREFFALRGQASIDDRARRPVNPRYAGNFIGDHAFHFADRVCSALRTAATTGGFDPDAPSIAGFTLVDADGGAPDPDIRGVEAGAVLDLSSLSAESFSIRANIASDAEPGSVRLELTGPRTAMRTENASPYSLFGEDGLGDYGGGTFPNGDYQLAATPYSGDDGRGEAGSTVSVAFSVTGSFDALASSVTGFTLVDADRDEDVVEIGTGAIVDVSSSSADSFSIRANVRSSAGIGSMHLALRGPAPMTATQALAPYVLHGDDGNGDYGGGVLPNGNYRITATPYPEPGLGGGAGTAATVAFSVTGSFDAGSSPITGLVLFDASEPGAGQDLQGIEDGAVLDLSASAADRLSIRADVRSAPRIDSVRFELTGRAAATRIDNMQPFALHGDDQGGRLAERRLSAHRHPLFEGRRRRRGDGSHDRCLFGGQFAHPVR